MIRHGSRTSLLPGINRRDEAEEILNVNADKLNYWDMEGLKKSHVCPQTRTVQFLMIEPISDLFWHDYCFKSIGK
jgi:hypothetical protein